MHVALLIKTWQMVETLVRASSRWPTRYSQERKNEGFGPGQRLPSY